uniref:TIL domain-containing protein n=1 Tax=Anopheles epiroticus TaxID=199890 RepID=A0A182P750_9DIPT
MKFLSVALLGAMLLVGVVLADSFDETSGGEPAELDCPAEPCKGEYEEYRCCGSCFQETCFPSKQKCKTKCTKGCFCLDGFVREYEGVKPLTCQANRNASHTDSGKSPRIRAPSRSQFV